MLPKYPIKAQNATNTESTDVAVFIVPDGAISGNEVDISGSSDPLVYRALLTQSSTNAPTATVLENTLDGTVVWTYGSAGIYNGTLTGAFTANKTAVQIASNLELAGSAFGYASIRQVDANVVRINTISIDVDAPSDSLTNGLLTNTYVEILVYP